MREKHRLRDYLLLVFALVAMPLSAVAQRYSASYHAEPVEQVVQDLQQRTGYDFVYQKQVLSGLPDVTCQCTDLSLGALLHCVLLDHCGLAYEISGKTIVLKRAAGHHATQQRTATVSGTVVDANGEPLQWATVKIKGTGTGATTDTNGHFQIFTERQRLTVEVSYLGFNSATRTILAGHPAKIILHADDKSLDEVVVTGYQVLNKRSLTSAVSTAKMKDLERTDMSSLDQMLEGKIPDLLVNNNSFEVGVAPKIRIRGTSTLIGNREPLWVVDGIVVQDPVEISPEELNDPDYVNRIGNAIAGINPQDIERIDVLKDAAATAIYGTKAANGVIVVTTKRGYEGKPVVSYNFSMNYKVRPRYTDHSVDVMNSKERVQFSRELLQDHYQFPYLMTTVGYEKNVQDLYNGAITYDEFQKRVSADETRNTDWFKLLCHDALSTQHTASVSGGSSKSRYYASMGYDNEEDVIKANANERYTWSLNLDNTFSKLLTASFTFNGYHQRRSYYQDEIAPLNYAYTTTRTLPVYQDNGEYYYYQRKQSDGSLYNYNILNELANSYNHQKVNSMTFTTNLRFTFTDWLTANAILSVTNSNTDLENWWGERTWHIATLRGAEYGATIDDPSSSTCPVGGELNRTSVTNRSYTARFQVDANKFFGGDDQHNIYATFGVEANSAKYRSYASTQRGYFRDRGETFVSDIDPTIYTSYASWAMGNVPMIVDDLTNTLSTYLSVTYAYKQLWRVNLNGRVDGSNKFGDRSNDRFLPIWSVSGSYDVGHWINAKWIDYMTAKASYGFQGNMLDTESPVMTIRKGTLNSYYNENLSTINSHPNPDLKWEKTNSINLGLDMSFFDHRLEMELSAFYKKTSDAFMNKRVSSVNGVSSYVINGGDVTNKGYSFDITATPLRTRDFRWSVSTSLSKIFNSLDSRPASQTYELSDFLNGTALVEGQAVNTFYSYRFLGLSPVDGGPLIDDYYNNQEALRGLTKYDTYTTVLSASGKREADIQGSLTNTLRYRQWHASVVLGYSLGAKTRLFAMYGSKATGGYGSDIYSEKNYSRDYLKRWLKPGDEKTTNLPSIISQSSSAYYKYSRVWTDTSDAAEVNPIGDNYWEMYDYSDIRVVSADYLKLQSLSLTYELPGNILDRMGLQRLALTLSAYNLFTICDPALKGQTPTQGGFSTIQLSDRPSFSFGLNVQF